MTIFTIFGKELRDTLRDRRTLISSIVMPVVLMPLLILGMIWFAQLQSRQAQQKVLNIGIVDQQNAPDFAAFLAGQDKMKTTTPGGDPTTLIRDNKLDAAVIMPPDWQTAVAGQGAIGVTVLYNSTKTDSTTALNRITSALQQYDNGLVAQRMDQQGISKSLLVTPTAAPRDVATSQQQGGFFLSFFLPMFLVLWSLLGGMYTAIDSSAGEKERKTLEALLTAPVRRFEIVFGKLLAVSTTAVITVALALTSLYVAILRFGNSAMFGSAANGLNLSLAPTSVLVMFGVGVLLAITFGALELSTAIFAKSYREANTYVTPLYLIAILPVIIVNTMSNLQPATAIFLIPAVNAVLLFKEVLLGTLNGAHVAVTMASLALYAVISILIATKVFGRESVLFRS